MKPKCGVNEYRCPGTWQCIKIEYVCDGHNDCIDGSDEPQDSCGKALLRNYFGDILDNTENSETINQYTLSQT